MKWNKRNQKRKR